GYINFQDTDDQSRIEANYAGNYARLSAVKATYDPDNFFHVNQNIKPAAAAAADAVAPPTESAPTF
ncbi:BBE domain-containing protein, partial [Sinomonas atrocyanea]|uniref:BBE domain-containing protein n=1 Tax=Sinomonas atrocyanea TaxID=37927 RepID=UPI0035E9B39B